jgi:hypothetical protein
MYELNAENSNFKERSKSVFSTLANLESSLKKNQVQNDLETLNLSNETEEDFEPLETRSSKPKQTSDFEFKVPRCVPNSRVSKPNHPRTSHSNQTHYHHGNRRGRFVPDYLKNPQKWKKYSLEDVDDMNASTNRNAAMSFLRSLSKQTGQVETDSQSFAKLADPADFNKPIGRKKFNKLEQDETDEQEERDESCKMEQTTSSSSFFKNKRFNKRNMRRIEETDEAEEEKTSDSKTQNSDIDMKKNESDEDEFSEYKKNANDPDESAEFEERDLY